MSGATPTASFELDFLGMEKENPNKSQLQRLLEQRKLIRGMPTSLSNINPELLKTVIQSGTANDSKQHMFFRQNSFKLPSVPSTPKASIQTESEGGNAPLTIFYNGKVTVFDVPCDKAKIIMRLAEEGKLKTIESVIQEGKLKAVVPSSSSDQQKLLEKLNGDLPIARKKSLQRFLEKRKERLTMVSPYADKQRSE